MFRRNHHRIHQTLFGGGGGVGDSSLIFGYARCGWNFRASVTPRRSFASTCANRSAFLRAHTPHRFVPLMQSDEAIGHLNWLRQKHQMGQHCMLMGPPSSFPRLLALRFCELMQLDHEWIGITADTVEGDLTQRREIHDGSVLYKDEAVVRAAKYGRVLLVDGVQRAERNLLPLLNNLLENAEINLEDGSSLIAPALYDQLKEELGQNVLLEQRIQRVHEDFRCIFLMAPVPPFKGNPLDPPLRSRLAGRYVPLPGIESTHIALQSHREVDDNLSKRISSLSHTLSLLSQSEDRYEAEEFAADVPRYSMMTPFYLNDWIANRKRAVSPRPKTPHTEDQKSHPPNHRACAMRIASALCRTGGSSDGPSKGLLRLVEDAGPWDDVLSPHEWEQDSTWTNVKPLNDALVWTTEMRDALTRIKEDLDTGRHIAIVGERGSGRSTLAMNLCNFVERNIEPFVLYADMSCRELWMQRDTNDQGDTVWRESALVRAARNGSWCLMSGLEYVPAALPALHRLLVDGQMYLPDGQRMGEGEGWIPVHPNFRVIFLMDESQKGKSLWAEEGADICATHVWKPSVQSIEEILRRMSPNASNELISSVVRLHGKVRDSSRGKPSSSRSSPLEGLQFGLRQMAYVVSGGADGAWKRAEEAVMGDFMTSSRRRALWAAMKSSGLKRGADDSMRVEMHDHLEERKTSLKGDRPRLTDAHDRVRVPAPHYVPIEAHEDLIERVQHIYDSKALPMLLIGAQGVGKNKVVDRFLARNNISREYVQLHRDVTVSSLWSSRSLEDGKVVLKESPLVRALRSGRLLVLDEVDKAPPEVVGSLRALVQGLVRMPDGRVAVHKHMRDTVSKEAEIVEIHPSFGIIALANKSGFPFQGNDFFSQLGYLFATLPVGPPDVESTKRLLMAFAHPKRSNDSPTSVIDPHVKDSSSDRIVSKELIDGIASAFHALQRSDKVNYPYGVREAVQVVRHLAEYPLDDLTDALENVFSFERDPQARRHIADTFRDEANLHLRHEFTLSASPGASSPSSMPLRGRYDYFGSPGDSSGPKHGRPSDGKQHVGGNTWAGGTGGRDTAGLGGKHGPYRLDGGFDIHQLSDEEKRWTDPVAEQRARTMAAKALEEKLSQIGMDPQENAVYQRLYESMKGDISQLRRRLDGIESVDVEERRWIRNQSEGELDETRLVEGLMGDTRIWKRRAQNMPTYGSMGGEERPKLIRFLFDVSASMYHFNGFDGRLTRSLECALLLMEGFHHQRTKFRLQLLGHSGDSERIELIKPDATLPRNRKERFHVLEQMAAHAQYTWAGDNTLEATAGSIEEMAALEGRQSHLFIISDANFKRHGISPKAFADLLRVEDVDTTAIFLSTFGKEAENLRNALPKHKAYICQNASELPELVFKKLKERMV